MFINDNVIMDWKNYIMENGILSFKSSVEPYARYTIAYCSLHKPEDWFIVVRSTITKGKVVSSKTFEIESEKELIKLLQKLKRLRYYNCVLEEEEE